MGAKSQERNYETSHLLLACSVDDVLTTGQTLRLACRMLLELGALRVTVAVLAVVEPAGRLAQASGHWGDHEKSG